MWTWLLILAQVLAGSGGDPVDLGRRATALIESGRYAEAEDVLREGLEASRDTTGPVYAALQHNLGAALFHQETWAASRRAFDRAARVAPSDAERVRALYNAGNAAAAGGSLDDALAYYRRALRIDPAYEPARFNFEFVARQKAAQPSPAPEPPPEVDPSPFAQRLKRQAEVLAAEQRYTAAVRLMTDGMERDSTVEAYREFIGRLQEIERIDRTGVPRDAPSGGPALRTTPDTTSRPGPRDPS